MQEIPVLSNSNEFATVDEVNELVTIIRNNQNILLDQSQEPNTDPFQVLEFVGYADSTGASASTSSYFKFMKWGVERSNMLVDLGLITGSLNALKPSVYMIDAKIVGITVDPYTADSVDLHQAVSVNKRFALMTANAAAGTVVNGVTVTTGEDSNDEGNLSAGTITILTDVYQLSDEFAVIAAESGNEAWKHATDFNPGIGQGGSIGSVLNPDDGNMYRYIAATLSVENRVKAKWVTHVTVRRVGVPIV
jgi:hypothetical protein